MQQSIMYGRLLNSVAIKRAILLPCSPIFSLALCSSHFSNPSEGGLSNCTNGPKSPDGDGDVTDGAGETIVVGWGETAASGDGDVCAFGWNRHADWVRPFASSAPWMRAFTSGGMSGSLSSAAISARSSAESLLGSA